MIYFVKTQESDFVKIGYAKRDVTKRVNKFQTGCPERLTIIHQESGGYEDESSYHKLFKKSHYRGEWFYFSHEISEYIEEVKLTEKYLELSEDKEAELCELREYEKQVEWEEFNRE